MNKQNIDWKEVEKYLECYVGELVEITESKDIIYIGSKFPDEYSGSRPTNIMLLRTSQHDLQPT